MEIFLNFSTYQVSAELWLTFDISKKKNNINPFTPKLIMEILPTIQEENDWVM